MVAWGKQVSATRPKFTTLKIDRVTPITSSQTSARRKRASPGSLSIMRKGVECVLRQNRWSEPRRHG